LTKTEVTLGSLVMRLKASSMALAVAPPPTSSKLIKGGNGGQGGRTEEVGGFTTIEFDDIHGSHGKTSTIDKTPNRSLPVSPQNRRTVHPTL
jgi:hypothetical protein